MKIKSLPIGQVKAGPDDGLEDGEFIVYPSTFTRTPDSYGDVVRKGAFARDIKDWSKSGNILPGLFGHRLDDPDFYVAYATDQGEDDHGWWVRGKFDMDSPKGPHVYRLVKGRRLNQLSFAYEVRDQSPVELEDGQKATELRDLKVYEFSFVPVGANQDTSVVAVKALTDSVKLGLKLSDENLSALREARDTLDSVISDVEGDGEDDQEEASGKAKPGSGASDDERDVKSPVQGSERKSGPSVLNNLAALTKTYAVAYGNGEGVDSK